MKNPASVSKNTSLIAFKFETSQSYMFNTSRGKEHIMGRDKMKNMEDLKYTEKMKRNSGGKLLYTVSFFVKQKTKYKSR